MVFGLRQVNQGDNLAVCTFKLTGIQPLVEHVYKPIGIKSILTIREGFIGECGFKGTVHNKVSKRSLGIININADYLREMEFGFDPPGTVINMTIGVTLSDPVNKIGYC